MIRKLRPSRAEPLLGEPSPIQDLNARQYMFWSFWLLPVSTRQLVRRGPQKSFSQSHRSSRARLRRSTQMWPPRHVWRLQYASQSNVAKHGCDLMFWMPPLFIGERSAGLLLQRSFTRDAGGPSKGISTIPVRAFV